MDGISAIPYATVREPLQHAIGAERHWIGALRGAMDASENPAEAESIDALESFRKSTADATRACLRATPDPQLHEPRARETFHGTTPALVPAHVVLRTQTHLHRHAAWAFG